MNKIKSQTIMLTLLLSVFSITHVSDLLAEEGKDCDTSKLKDCGRQGEIGVSFVHTDFDESESDASLYARLFFPAWGKFNWGLRKFTIQSELFGSVNEEKTVDNYFYNDNEIWLNTGIFTYFGDNGEARQGKYDPYDPQSNTGSLQLEFSKASSEKISTTVLGEYLYYSGSLQHYENNLIVGVGKEFNSDSNLEGEHFYAYYFGEENCSYDDSLCKGWIPESGIKDIRIYPSIGYQYFSPEQTGLENSENIYAELSAKIVTGWLDDVDNTNAIVNFTLGHNWDIDDNDQDDGLYALLGLSILFANDDYNSYSGGKGLRGSARGRLRRRR